LPSILGFNRIAIVQGQLARKIIRILFNQPSVLVSSANCIAAVEFYFSKQCPRCTVRSVQFQSIFSSTIARSSSPFSSSSTAD